MIRLHVLGKGRDDKVEAVNLPKGVYRLICEYLDERGTVNRDESLFASRCAPNFGRHMISSSISKIVKEAMRAAGYDAPCLTAHSLGHTSATTSLKSGASLREVQQILRHKNVAVTQIYLHELDELENQATKSPSFAP